MYISADTLRIVGGTATPSGLQQMQQQQQVQQIVQQQQQHQMQQAQVQMQQQQLQQLSQLQQLQANQQQQFNQQMYEQREQQQQVVAAAVAAGKAAAAAAAAASHAAAVSGPGSDHEDQTAVVVGIDSPPLSPSLKPMSLNPMSLNPMSAPEPQPRPKTVQQRALRGRGGRKSKQQQQQQLQEEEKQQEQQQLERGDYHHHQSAPQQMMQNSSHQRVGGDGSPDSSEEEEEEAAPGSWKTDSVAALNPNGVGGVGGRGVDLLAYSLVRDTSLHSLRKLESADSLSRLMASESTESLDLHLNGMDEQGGIDTQKEAAAGVGEAPKLNPWGHLEHPLDRMEEDAIQATVRGRGPQFEPPHAAGAQQQHASSPSASGLSGGNGHRGSNIKPLDLGAESSAAEVENDEEAANVGLMMPGRLVASRSTHFAVQS